LEFEKKLTPGYKVVEKMGLKGNFERRWPSVRLKGIKSCSFKAEDLIDPEDKTFFEIEMNKNRNLVDGGG
jgi:hypothetical protein